MTFASIILVQDTMEVHCMDQVLRAHFVQVLVHGYMGKPSTVYTDHYELSHPANEMNTLTIKSSKDRKV